MEPSRTTLADRTEYFLQEIRRGNQQALGDVYALYRERLWRMVTVRLDKRISGRLDADDVLQEAFLDVARRISEYLSQPTVPFYIWLRFLTGQRMLMMQRNHLGTRMRDPNLEVSLPQGGHSFANPDSMAGRFVSSMTSPSQAAIRSEMQDSLRQALASLDPLDREVLALRHFEELTNVETAQVLGISKDAASKRHIRALKRLRELLGDIPGAVLGG